MGYVTVNRDNNRRCHHCTELTLVRARCPEVKSVKWMMIRRREMLWIVNHQSILNKARYLSFHSWRRCTHFVSSYIFFPVFGFLSLLLLFFINNYFFYSNNNNNNKNHPHIMGLGAFWLLEEIVTIIIKRSFFFFL